MKRQADGNTIFVNDYDYDDIILDLVAQNKYGTNRVVIGKTQFQHQEKWKNNFDSLTKTLLSEIKPRTTEYQGCVVINLVGMERKTLRKLYHPILNAISKYNDVCDYIIFVDNISDAHFLNSFHYAEFKVFDDVREDKKKFDKTLVDIVKLASDSINFTFENEKGKKYYYDLKNKIFCVYIGVCDEGRQTYISHKILNDWKEVKVDEEMLLDKYHVDIIKTELHFSDYIEGKNMVGLLVVDVIKTNTFTFIMFEDYKWTLIRNPKATDLRLQDSLRTRNDFIMKYEFDLEKLYEFILLKEKQNEGS